MQREIIQKHIDACPNPVIAFCVYGVNRIPDEYFREIHSHLADNFSLITLTDMPHDRFCMPGDVFVLSSKEIQHLDTIQIFIVTDGYNFNFPKYSWVIAFPHSFHGYTCPHRLLAHRYAIENFDVYCSSTPRIGMDEHILKTAHEFRLNPGNIKRRRKAFYFASTGCPRIATIHKNLQTMQARQDSILYAPTDYAWGNSGDHRMYAVDKYGVGIVRNLLEHFSEYRIVFRPCATTLDHPFTRKVIETFEGHPRFVVSQDYDHKPEFARAALLITDYSNIGETFAFSCSRPELRIFPEQERQNPTMTATGFHLHPDDNFVPLAKFMLSRGEDFWRSHIEKAFGTYTINPETTFANIKELIHCLLQGKRPPNCAIIQRDSTLPPWTMLDYIKQVFIGDHMDEYLVRRFFVDFPENTIALALYCYVMARTTPDYFISEAVATAIKDRIPDNNDVECYGDISPHIFKELLNSERLSIVRRKEIFLLPLIDEIENAVVPNWNLLHLTFI